MTSEDIETLETLGRLILRHGEEAAGDCVTAALDLADSIGTDRARLLLENALHGGQLPAPDSSGRSAGHPRNPDAGLIAVWATVEAVREERQLSINAACKWLCREKGTRRNELPTGIGLITEDRENRWNHHETLRGLHKTARKRRDRDPDFRAVCDLCLPEIRSRLFG